MSNFGLIEQNWKLSHIFMPVKTKKNTPSKVACFTAQFSFQYWQTAPNQPKFHILFHKNGSLCDFYIMTLFANCKVIMRTTIARILCTVNSLPMIISEGFSGRKKNTCQKHFSLMKSTTFKHAKCKFNFVFCPLRIKA